MQTGIGPTKLFATIEKVEKTEEEWRQELSPQAYYVLREAGTEAPRSSELNDVKEPGTFVCKGCGAPLFTTAAKFESGSGWPSFYQPVDKSAVDLSVDYKLIMPRTEVCCGSCGGHLGHVFDDGPQPTGQRYCMNGIAMDFKADETNPDLAAAVVERQSSPFKPTAESQLPGILFNGAIGVLFFGSFVTRIGDIESLGGTPVPFDFFPVIPAVFYGVMAAQGISRLL
ncbi:Peptide methionine sulfoxide reductase MsrB [Seminavis robusta]|uniref:Peptide-methionine (R)-S-oxide reductase n=1 Tax=Seminavis robusta TaxID=568900 RepID=A0A9N8EFX0_9STRA|nr:Peptide methionine sulfoxide reductase MsrB [Seminavis robusta]|eukprot:Sro1063_g237150.1 Peptide methionine sulfoxide reductase MsrB (227) ;mRNA; f:30315-30995